VQHSNFKFFRVSERLFLLFSLNATDLPTRFYLSLSLSSHDS
jgi:hypothetical protein